MHRMRLQLEETVSARPEDQSAHCQQFILACFMCFGKRKRKRRKRMREGNEAKAKINKYLSLDWKSEVDMQKWQIKWKTVGNNMMK